MDKTLLFGERQDDETSQTRSRYCLEIIRCIALTAGRDMLPASLFAPGAGTPCSHAPLHLSGVGETGSYDSGQARLMEKLPLGKFPYPLLYDHPLGSRLCTCPLPSKSACSGFDRRLD